MDARHLAGGRQSGVGGYTLALLRTMVFAHPDQNFIVFTSGSRSKAKPAVQQALGNILKQPNVVHRHRAVPNRALNLLLLVTGRPSFERLCGTTLDVIWHPNLNFLPKSRAPVVITFHDLSYAMMPRLYSPWRRLWHALVRPKATARTATAVISPSKTTTADLIRLYGLAPERIRTIPHGVDGVFSTRPKSEDHGVRSRHDLPRHYLLHIGTDEPRKNLVRLVRAFERVKRRSETMRRLDMKLVLAGAETRGRRLETETLHRDVLRLGYVEDADRPALYRGATAFVFPSLYEGFGITILEAFASGAPVIASQNSAMLEVGGEAALFIDPENEEDLARAIQIIIEDERLRTHLAQEGLKRVENYHWEKTAEETIKTLETVAFQPFN